MIENQPRFALLRSCHGRARLLRSDESRQEINNDNIPTFNFLFLLTGICGGYQPPQGLWVSIHAADVAEGRRLFDALAQGGQTTMPFEATFWSPGFGMVKDRYGTPWMMNVATQS